MQDDYATLHLQRELAGLAGFPAMPRPDGSRSPMTVSSFPSI